MGGIRNSIVLSVALISLSLLIIIVWLYGKIEFRPVTVRVEEWYPVGKPNLSIHVIFSATQHTVDLDFGAGQVVVVGHTDILCSGGG